jgi:glycerophosphoryl diester phosphodiesterase
MHTSRAERSCSYELPQFAIFSPALWRHGREGVDDGTCTARRIPPPSHLFIDNTLQAIAAAFGLGADVVEVDVKLTKDNQFVLGPPCFLRLGASGIAR